MIHPPSLPPPMTTKTSSFIGLTFQHHLQTAAMFAHPIGPHRHRHGCRSRLARLDVEKTLMQWALDTAVLDEPFRETGLSMGAKVMKRKEAALLAENGERRAIRVDAGNFTFVDDSDGAYIDPTHIIS